MRRFFGYKILLIVLLITGCTKYDTSGIKDNGEWVSIYDAPLTSGYILYNNDIYALMLDDLHSYNPASFWEGEGQNIGVLLENVDIATFQVNIQDGSYPQPYAKDKRRVYCPLDYDILDDEGPISPYSLIYEKPTVIPGADPKTFKYLGDGYAVDKNGMYSRGEKIEWNDSIIAYYAKFH